MKGESGANDDRAELQRTHQDDPLDVLGRAPMKHSCGVVLLHILVHALDLLVARDEQRVVSGVDGRQRNCSGICQKKMKSCRSFTGQFLCSYTVAVDFPSHKDSTLEFVLSER